MTIDVYPVHAQERGGYHSFIHADKWDDGSTMNMANGNFYSFFSELLGEQNVPDAPGIWKIKFVADALRMNRKNLPPRYVSKLKQIVARAEILKADYICYS